MSPAIWQALQELRTWMFEHVYTNPVAKSEEGKAEQMVAMLYDYYTRHSEEMPDEYLRLMSQGEKPERVVCDYIAGMTDYYAINRFTELFIPKTWKK
jgi:dGTPase